MIGMNQLLILVIVLLVAKTSAATFLAQKEGAVTFVDEDSNKNDTVKEPCTRLPWPVLRAQPACHEPTFVHRKQRPTGSIAAVWKEVQSGIQDESQRLCESDSCRDGDLALHCEMNPGDDGDTEEDEDSTDCVCE